jgi:hypothetical protein
MGQASPPPRLPATDLLERSRPLPGFAGAVRWAAELPPLLPEQSCHRCRKVLQDFGHPPTAVAEAEGWDLQKRSLPLSAVAEAVRWAVELPH